MYDEGGRRERTTAVKVIAKGREEEEERRSVRDEKNKKKFGDEVVYMRVRQSVSLVLIIHHQYVSFFHG